MSERVEDMVLGTAATVGKWLDAGRRVVTLGGEHSVSIGAVQAHAARNEGLSVLHLDAHGDNRDRYEESRLNHACTMARIREMCDPCVSVGLRSVDASEMAVLVPERTFFAHDIAAAGDDAWMDRVAAALGDTVYITIDLDVFDPSVIAATGTPVPGGLSWYQVTALLAKVIQRRRVVGFDIVELCPTIPHPPSVMAAVTLLYHVLALMDGRRPGVDNYASASDNGLGELVMRRAGLARAAKFGSETSAVMRLWIICI